MQQVDRLPAVPFYFIRHGETDWNKLGRMQGQTDIPLNDTGRHQAAEAAFALRECTIATICTSPLKRAMETAKIIQGTVNASIESRAALQEVGCGENEGMERGQWYTDWLDGRSVPRGGETLSGFCNRLMGGIAEALGHPGPVLVVSHGQVFRSMIGIIGAELESPTPNGVPMYLEPLDRGNAGWSVQILA